MIRGMFGDEACRPLGRGDGGGVGQRVHAIRAMFGDDLWFWRFEGQGLGMIPLHG